MENVPHEVNSGSTCWLRSVVKEVTQHKLDSILDFLALHQLLGRASQIFKILHLEPK